MEAEFARSNKTEDLHLRSIPKIDDGSLTSDPVPEVFNAYTIADYGFILMSKIPGLSLTQCWENLTGDSKTSIVRQLESFILEWRQIEGPLFGSIDGGPCEDVLFKYPWDAEYRYYGPFLTRKEFNQGWLRLSVTPDPMRSSQKEMSL